MKKAPKRAPAIDTVDVLSLAVFAVTIVWEARALKQRPELRRFGDLEDASPESLTDPAPPPDRLIPVGYERRDTVASLSMLVGNAASDLGTSAALGTTLRFLARHRVAHIGARRGSFLITLGCWTRPAFANSSSQCFRPSSPKSSRRSSPSS